jgi:hypothetical protein
MSVPGRAGAAAPLGVGGGLAAAAAPVQGSADAVGATPIASVNPTTAADAMDAVDTVDIRRRSDMSHLSRGGTPR